MTDTAAPPEFDPSSRELRTDLYGTLRRLREEFPVARSAEGWALSRHDDVTSVLRDPRFRADHPERDPAAPRANDVMRLAENMLFRDGAEHSRLRAAVGRAFTPGAVRVWQGAIRERADELLDTVASEGGGELVRTLCQPLPVAVISDLMGVPADERHLIASWSKTLAALVERPFPMERWAECLAVTHDFVDYCRRLIDDHRRRPAEDLTSALVGADGEDALSDDEIVTMLILILFAGHETTTTLLGNGIRLLLDHPDQEAIVRADPTLVPRAVEEMLRFESPLQHTTGGGRWAVEDVELRGRRIAAGEKVIALLGAANRDENEFARPDTFDLTRTPNRHVAFGYGAHFCVGAQLARLEAHVVFDRLLDRFPAMKAVDPEPSWTPTFVVRTLRSLVVTV